MATTSSSRRVKSHKHEEHESCYFMNNAEPTEDKSFLNEQQHALVEYLDNRAEERAGLKKIDESKIDHNRKNPQKVLDFIRAKIQKHLKAIKYLLEASQASRWNKRSQMILHPLKP